VVLFALGFFACEQTLESEEIPYELKLVINGQLKAGEPVNDIYVGRTLPISYAFQDNFADLEDAQVGIVFRDSLYLLQHSRRGLYQNLDLPVIAGEKYGLLVQWKNLFATGETTVPLIGQVNGAGVENITLDNQSTPVLAATITPYSNEAYGIIWVSYTINDQRDFEADRFGNIMIANLQGLSGGLKVYSDAIPLNILNADNHYFGADIYTYDNSFFYYYITSSSAQIEDAVFGQPNSSVKWNIDGDGIGIFIGRNDTTITLN
jgi:hypothetical protein